MELAAAPVEHTGVHYSTAQQIKQRYRKKGAHYANAGATNSQGPEASNPEQSDVHYLGGDLETHGAYFPDYERVQQEALDDVGVGYYQPSEIHHSSYNHQASNPYG